MERGEFTVLLMHYMAPGDACTGPERCCVAEVPPFSTWCTAVGGCGGCTVGTGRRSTGQTQRDGNSTGDANVLDQESTGEIMGWCCSIGIDTYTLMLDMQVYVDVSIDMLEFRDMLMSCIII